MKLHKITYIILALATTVVVSCGKIPANGDLDGQWQLMEISTKANPSDTQYTVSTSKKADEIYWRFQLDLLNIHTCSGNLNGRTPDTSARFKHEGNRLDVTKTYIHFFSRDSLLKDPSTTILEPIGISGNAENFNVAHLSRKSMILVNDNKRLVFRKF